MQPKSQIKPIQDGERVKKEERGTFKNPKHGENEEPTCFRARKQSPATKRAMGTRLSNKKNYTFSI